MIARAFALALCGIVVDALPNSTEPQSALQGNVAAFPNSAEPLSALQGNVTMDQRDDAVQGGTPLSAGDVRTESHVADDAMVENATAVRLRLRGSIPSAVVPDSRQLSRRRRRRKSSSTDPCSGIETAVCKTSEYIFCYGGCLGISSCVDACKKSLYDPCVDSLKSACDKSALDICEEAVKKAGSESCAEICTEAAATADAAGGGPEDPAADVIAADIEASCEMSCEAAVDDSGLTPGTDAFAEAVCKGIGF